MAKRTTHKSSAQGKAQTIARRQARAVHYAQAARTTKAGRAR